MKGTDQSDECRIQLSIREMRACAHARTGAVGVVRRPGAFGVLEVALDGEDSGFFEVDGVEVGCPCVLWCVNLVDHRNGSGREKILPYRRSSRRV